MKIFKQSTPGFFILLLLFLFSATEANAQEISVKSFDVLPNDMDARVNHPVKDQNGEKCALIKVVTDQEGFVWEGGMLGITKVEKKTGEYWVYVPHGSEKITIKHGELGVLRDYVYPGAIEEATVYEMELTTAKVETVVKPREIRSAYVIIHSTPDSADLYIDGQYQGQTPYRRKLENGEHSYRLEKSLYHTRAGKFKLSAEKGRKEMQFKLEPNFGTLKVSSEPESGMRIYLDGIYTGKKTPATISKVKSGRHTLTLKDEWFQPHSQHVSVDDGEISEATMQLEPIYGEVKITTDPPSKIFIDGQKVGFNTYSGRLSEGIHTFKAHKEKYADVSVERKIRKNEQPTIELSPTPKYGELDINTEPYNARIIINGKDYGRTPKVIHELLVGDYNLVVKKDGYFSEERTVRVREDETTGIDLALSDKIEVTVNTQPSRARLFVDGEFKGTTPVAIDLPKEKVGITLKKGGYRDEKETIHVSSEQTSYSYKLSELKIYSGTSIELEWGPDWGLEVGFFGDRIFISGAVGQTKRFKFNKEIDVKDVHVKDIENYSAEGYKSYPNRKSEAKYQSQDIYMTGKFGVQLTWPFPFFIHAGFGARYTAFYKKVYQAKHDYYPMNNVYSPELEKGDYFTTPNYHIGFYPSLVLGTDIPVFDNMIIGADYWFNTEVGPTYNFSVGLMFSD
jgi:hypothetical protein